MSCVDVPAKEQVCISMSHVTVPVAVQTTAQLTLNTQYTIYYGIDEPPTNGY